MAKSTRGERSRDEILAAAGRLFSLHGYFHTSMNDILEAVSLSKGAFYYHFKSKTELALGVLGRVREDISNALIEPMHVAPSEDRLRMMLELTVDLHESGQWDALAILARFAQELGDQAGELSESVHELMQWLLEQWKSVMADAQSAGQVGTDLDAGGLAALTVASLLGAISCREAAGDQLTVHEVVGQLLSLVIGRVEEVG